MKELTIKEKAKAYDKALERAKRELQACGSSDCDAARQIFRFFPELAESEDEKIKKVLIGWINLEPSTSFNDTFDGFSKEQILAWLEKQVSQDNTEDVDILHRFSFYSYKDEPNVLYLSGLYVNEEYRNKGIGTKILEVADEVVKSLNCRAIRLKTRKDSDAERLYRIHGYNSLATEDKDEIWLEKQGEQKPIDKIQLGKKYKCIASPRYSTFMIGEIYKPEDEFLCSLMNLCSDCFELIEDGEPKDYNSIDPHFGKSVDKVEPKFHEGDWVVWDNKISYHIDNIYHGKESLMYTITDAHNMIHSYSVKGFDNNAHLWTIQDAKNGDVLADDYGIYIFEKFDECDKNCYVCVGAYQYSQKVYECEHMLCSTDAHPATKEQHDTIEKAMADAGWEFDIEKKELKKIEQKPAEDGCKNSYDITTEEKDMTEYKKGFECGKQRVLKYPEDFGLCKRTLTAWSEEDNDDAWMNDIISKVENNLQLNKAEIDWLKSLKDKYTWKPSDEQMGVIEAVINNRSFQRRHLDSLYADLKKLKV